MKKSFEYSQTSEHAGENIAGYDVEKSLYLRGKHSRLDNYQRKFLDEVINNKKEGISHISLAFRVSKGVLYNLRKKSNYSNASNLDLLKENTKLIRRVRIEE